MKRISVSFVSLVFVMALRPAVAQVSNEIPGSILTPDRVQSSIGAL
jgi:hypothetical protein